METLAETLLEKETLSGKEIKRLINFKESDIREPVDFLFENEKKLNNNENALLNKFNNRFRLSRNNNNNNNNNNNDDSNGGGGGRSGPGGGSGGNNNNNPNELQGILTPETDLLNPQPSMFLKSNSAAAAAASGVNQQAAANSEI